MLKMIKSWQKEEFETAIEYNFNYKVINVYIFIFHAPELRDLKVD